MEILTKKWNGIEYYLVDIYETEFKFGIVYHFISDEDEKFCLYKDNKYNQINNKKYLRKIAKELKVNTDILFRKYKKGKILDNKNRLTPEEEYQIYDEVSKIINELYPDISYRETMEILNDDSGIYEMELDEDEGCYYHKTKEIYLNKKNERRVRLHEAIHKLTDRKGFLEHKSEKYIGLIEGGTEKICEDKYGDKTSHIEHLYNKDIHVNFSRDATYPLPQIIYRQMAYLVNHKMADKSLINGDTDFFNKFSDLYGRDLFLYLNHITKRFLRDRGIFEKESSFEKKQLTYLKLAQEIMLKIVFNIKFKNIQTPNDIINYMSELRDFEYVFAKIEDDTTFKDYYNNRYKDIVQLAQEKGIDVSTIKEFEYSEVDFYPERNREKLSELEITKAHINNLCQKKQIDCSKCTRIKVEPSPNFFDLDIILQNGIPISAVENDSPGYINNIEHEEVMYNIIKKELGIEDDGIELYSIAFNTYIAIKADGSSEIYSTTLNKIYNLAKKEVELGVTPQDIEKVKAKLDTTTIQDHETIQIDMQNMVNTGNKRNIMFLFNSIKNFFINRKSRRLEPPKKSMNISNKKIEQSSFREKLSPNHSIYEHSTKISEKRTTEKSHEIREK